MTLSVCGRSPPPEGRRRRERGRARDGHPGGWWNTCRLSVSAVVLAVAVVLPPATAAAQEDGPGSHRKWLGAAIGAVVIGVPTFTSADFPTLGTCARTECFAPLATAVGFTLGFLLGKEFDDGAARRFVAGPRLDLRPRHTVQLPFLPDRGRAAGAAALWSGAEGLVRLQGETLSPLGGIRGLRDVALVEESAAIVAATASGLFALPTARDDIPGRRIDARGVRLVAAGSGGGLVVSGAGGLLGFSSLGRGTRLEVSEAARTRGDPLAADLVWPRASRIAWVLEGPRLVARDGGTLAEVAALELSAAARSLDVDAALGVVAAGRDGVFVIDLSDPAMPRLAARYQGIRSALDVALLESRAYVAAGEQGLVIVDLTRPSAPAVSGVVRNLGSPSLVLRTSGQVWVVDGATGEAHSVSFPGVPPPDSRVFALRHRRDWPPSDR